VERKGKAARQRDICLRGVEQWPDCTAAELAVHLGLERHVTSRRLPELRDCEPPLITNPRGLEDKAITRPCRIVKSKSMVWRRVGKPELVQLRLT
jgi:hypothetical protein